MAVRRSALQKQALAAFVHTLYEQSPYVTWADFARAADVHPVNISDWQRAQTAPDGWNLYKLIKAAGGAPAALAALPRDDQAAIAESLEELASMIRLVLQALGTGDEDPGSPAAGEARE